MSKVGREYVLWHCEYRSSAYIDQMGRGHDGYVVLEQIPVTVNEVKQVPNTWGKGTSPGWKALAKDGREFTCNWEHFPDDSSTPSYFWDGYRHGNELWQPVDAVQAYGFGLAHVTPEGERAIPEGATICEKHNTAFLLGDYCFRCNRGL